MDRAKAFFFKKGEAWELTSNHGAEHGTYDVLRASMEQRSEARPIPGGGRSRARETEYETITTSGEARSHSHTDSPADEEIDAGNSVKQKEGTGSATSNPLSSIPPIVIEDYGAKSASEQGESLQEGPPSHYDITAKATDANKKRVVNRPRSRSLIDMRSQLEKEVRSLAEDKGKFADEIGSARELEREMYYSNRKLSALPGDKVVSRILRARAMSEKLQGQSVQSLRAEILKEPGGQEFIEGHDYSRGHTPQSRTPKKSSAELFEEKKRKATEFFTKGVGEQGASQPGDEIAFNRFAVQIPGDLNDREEGSLSRSFREASARESQMLEEFPGLKNSRLARRDRRVSEGTHTKQNTRPEPRREPANDQPWPSKEDPIW